MPNGNIRILGLPRYDLGSLASGSTIDGQRPLSKLVNREPWDVARLTKVDPRLAYVKGAPSMPLGYYGPAPRVGGVSWVNHNSGLGATARSILLAPGSTYTVERVTPNNVDVVSGTWSSSDFTRITDDPYSLDGNRLDMTSSGLGQIVVDFTAPASNPVTGPELQLVRIALSYGATVPTSINVLLRVGVLPFQAWAAYPGSSPMPPSGSVIWIAFDAQELIDKSDPGGDQLNASITVDMPSADRFSVEAVDWLADRGVTAGSLLADGGFQPVTMDRYDEDWGDTVSGTVGGGPQQTFLHSFGDAGNVEGVGEVVSYFRDPLNTAGFLDLGEFVVGPVFIPRINIAWGKFSGGRFRDTATEGDGGSRWGVRREPTRDVTVKLMNLSPKEANSLQERLWRAGQLTPYVVSLRPESQYEQAMTTIYGTTKSYPSINALPGNLRSIEWEMEEKL